MTRRTKVDLRAVHRRHPRAGVESSVEAAPRRQQAPARRPDRRLRRIGTLRARSRQLRELRLHDDRDSGEPRHHQDRGGQRRHAGVNSATASAPGLDPTGALAILFILVVVLLAADADARGPEVAADVDPPGLPDPLRARRVPQRHRFREPDRQPARGDPGHRGRGHARRARGDARRPRADQEVDRARSTYRRSSRSATRSSTSSRTTRSSPAAAFAVSKGRSRNRTPSRST